MSYRVNRENWRHAENNTAVASAGIRNHSVIRTSLIYVTAMQPLSCCVAILSFFASRRLQHWSCTWADL